MGLRLLEDWLGHLIDPDGDADEVFLRPPGEPALIAAGSVSWRVFKNPLAVYIGGVTAVLLQLAEPRVGAGVAVHVVSGTADGPSPAHRAMRRC